MAITQKVSSSAGTLRKPRDPRRREEEKGADRHEMENADEIVECRVARPFLVAVVEAVQAGEQDPAGKRCEEKRDLSALLDRVLGSDGVVRKTTIETANASVSPTASASMSIRLTSPPLRRFPVART